MFFVEGGTAILLGDMITHEGTPWLVPSWSDAPLEGWTTPTRIVSMLSFPTVATPVHPDCDYQITVPVPQRVLDGELTSEDARHYRVIESPDIRFSIPTKH
ncbi:MAG: hypothetical protein V4574_11990 [Pseudomonadota bacterium]